MKVKEALPAYRGESKNFTYQDYLDLPEDGNHYQVINGELIMTPAPSTNHQIVSSELGFALKRFVDEQDLGLILTAPVDLVLANDVVLQPDLLYVAKERLHIIKRQNIGEAPDLVVEILSPSTGYYDLVEKKEIYREFGVREYWIVDPMKKWVEVYWNEETEAAKVQRVEREGVVTSKLLDGFEIDMELLFKSLR